MIRNLKALGLVLVAVFAMSAVAASGASAAVEFNAEAGTTKLTATNQTGTEDKFVTDAGEIHCKTTTAEGTVATFPTTSVTFSKVAYDECKGPLNVTVTVDMHGCGYQFSAGATDAEGNFEGSARITGCETGKVIEVTAPGCTIKVGEQGPLTKVTYTNKGTLANREITTDVGITNIAYKEENTGIIHTCKHSGENTTGGVYTGSETATGSTAANVMKGIFIEG
jgi:hypothetical protein